MAHEESIALALGMVFSDETTRKFGQENRDRTRLEALQNYGHQVYSIDHKHEETRTIHIRVNNKLTPVFTVLPNHINADFCKVDSTSRQRGLRDAITSKIPPAQKIKFVLLDYFHSPVWFHLFALSFSSPLGLFLNSYFSKDGPVTRGPTCFLLPLSSFLRKSAFQVGAKSSCRMYLTLKIELIDSITTSPSILIFQSLQIPSRIRYSLRRSWSIPSSGRSAMPLTRLSCVH